MLKKTLPLLLLQFFIVAFILTYYLSLWRIDWEVPFNFWGDTIWFADLIKNMLEKGWVYHLPNLSAPFSLYSISYPTLSHTDWFIMKVISLFSNNYGIVLNVFWILSIFMTMWSATFSMTFLGIRLQSAIFYAIVYALLPYAFLRNIAHIQLVFYTVPVLCTVAIWLAQGCETRGSRSILILGYIFCILQGLNFTYFSFFTLVLFAFSILFSYFTKHTLLPLKKGGVLGVTLLVFSSINLLPSFIDWEYHGKVPHTAHRQAREAELYGLKLRRMLAPSISDHVPLFHKWAKKDSHADFPNENENTYARLGPLASLGLVFLLCVSLGLVKRKKDSACGVIDAISYLNLFLLLFSTVGGLGAIFNLWVPTFRTYNRFSVYIAFFSLLALGLYWQNFYDNLTSDKKKVIFRGLFVLVFVFSLYDQLQDSLFLSERRSSDEAEAIRLHTFIQDIEAKVPDNTMVYQLPVMPFPEDPGLVHMLPYEQGRPYLESSSLHWSWPSFSIQNKTWLSNIQKLQGIQLLDTLALSGFKLIWIDKFGYSDSGQEIIKSFVDNGASILGNSSDSRYIVLDISSIRNGLISKMGEDQFNAESKKILNIPTR